MTKKVNLDEIDERFIISSVRKERVAQEIVPPPLAPLAAAVSETVQAQIEPETPEFSKEEIKRKRKSQDYETLFIKEVHITARLGKTVYIRKEFHDRILKIVQVIGLNEVSLFSYIDNIIAHHFDTYQDDIVRLYNSKNANSIF